MNLTWITLFGGLCLLIYGLGITRENLEKIAGDQLRDILTTLTDNRLISFCTGFFMTLILQSSSAAIVMFIGFVSSSLLTLTQAMALILGADVGATITIQLMAFHVANYSLLLVIIGFSMMTLLGPDRASYGKFIMGLGFIFLGLWQMGEAIQIFQNSEVIQFGIKLLKDHLFFSILIGIILTTFFQSSSAFLGILISLSHTGLLPFSEALPLILGANIGSCGLPFLISLRSKDKGKQVALSHIALKVSGVLLMLPFLSYFSDFITSTCETSSRQIANAHLFFNVIISISFFPFIPLGAKLIQKFFPAKKEEEPFGPKYLNPSILSSPSFAFAQAKLETIRMSTITQEMLEKVIFSFRKRDPETLLQIKTLEDRLDILYQAIKDYLVQLSKQQISAEQASQQLELVILASDLEHIGDTIEKSIVPLVKIKIQTKLMLSEEGFFEIQEFHKKVSESFQLAISAFTTRDLELCHKVLRAKEEISDKELELREHHLERLRKGIQESIDTSALHLELLSYLRRINSFISNIAYSIIQKNLKPS